MKGYLLHSQVSLLIWHSKVRVKLCCDEMALEAMLLPLKHFIKQNPTKYMNLEIKNESRVRDS